MAIPPSPALASPSVARPARATDALSAPASQPGPASAGQRTRPIGLALFALLYLAALFVYSGRFAAIDEAVLFGLTRSLVTQGTFAADSFRWANRPEIVVLGETGPDGQLYTYFEPAQPVLAAPLYWVGTLGPAGGLAEAVLLLNPLVFAATGWLLWRLGRLLGYRPLVAAAGAITISLATPLWAYSKTFFREPLAALALVAAVYCLIRLRRGSAWWALAAGLAFGGGLLARTSNLLAAPAGGLLLIAALLAVKGNRQRLTRIAAFGGGAAVGVALLLAYTWVRFGDPLYSPYQPQYFGSSLWTGVWGLLLSPGKGLLLYAPVLLAATVAFPWFARRFPWLAAALAMTGAVFVLFFARYVFWWGGFAWGPRFLLAALPLLALPLFPAIEWALDARTHLPRIALGAVIGVSLLVQINSVTVRHGDYLYWLGQTRQETQPETGSLLTDFAASPVLAQWGWVTAEHSDLVWWGFRDGQPRVDWLLPALLALGLAGTILLLIGPGRFRAAWSPVRRPLLAGIVVLALVGATGLTLQTARSARAAPDLAAAARQIAAEAQPGDHLVTLLGHRGADFLNELDAPLPVLGLPLAGYPLDPDVAGALERATETSGRLWLVANQVDDADPRNGVGRWLAENAYPVRQAADSGVRVGLYLTGATTSLGLLDLPSPIAFERQLRLTGARSNPDAWRAGGAVTIETDWEVLGRPPAPYRLTAALVDPTGRVLATTNHEPHDGFYRLADATPGDRFSDRIGLSLPADTPLGVYYLALGVYDPTADRSLLVDGSNSTEARFGPFRVAGGETARRLTPGDPVGARVGESVELVSVAVARRAVAPGEALPVTLTWRALGPGTESYQVFVHLGTPGAPPIAQSDGLPAGGRFPTTFWQPGDRIRDEHDVIVPPETPPGDYVLSAGLYRLAAGRRLPVTLAGESFDAVPLGRVRVQ